MAVTSNEVLIELRRPPRNLFSGSEPGKANRLRFGLGPDLSIAMSAMIRKPGLNWELEDVEMVACREASVEDEVAAYRDLLRSAMLGDAIPFARADGVETQWRVVEPVLGNVTPVSNTSRGHGVRERRIDSWRHTADGFLPSAHSDPERRNRRRMMNATDHKKTENFKTAEHIRLKEASERSLRWKRWGPYLSERQWGTVREDFSEDGDAWNDFTHDQARSRAYRWGEDGLAGISDDRQTLCFALALWNGYDPILKERLFGLTNAEGNHGEDVKEYYFYLDSTPTHSYMKYLYKYPQSAYPYLDLVETNRRRTRNELEYELLDTGIFDEDRYFDVFVEYAKLAPEDILIRITAANRGPDAVFCACSPWSGFATPGPGRQGRKSPCSNTLLHIKRPIEGGAR